MNRLFSRNKDGRAAFRALIANHAGDTKYRAISKKRMNLLQNIKWNGRSYPLESHVSNHRQAVDDLNECALHITVRVPDDTQRVEYLIDSINCTDNTLQATIGLIRANTNNMHQDFEAAASALIEVDPYRRSQKNPTTNRQANVSAIDFGAGRGSTGVDLRWHPRKEFKKLSDDQKDELTKWMKTQDGKKVIKESRKEAKRKRDEAPTTDKNGERSGGNWKKKFKSAIKTPNGLKTVMAVLAEEEKSNQAMIAAFQTASQPVPLPPAPTTVTSAPPTTPPPTPQVSLVQAAMPATTVKLQSILKPR